MLVTDQWIGGDPLNIASIFPHFQIELHAVIDEEMNSQCQRAIGHE